MVSLLPVEPLREPVQSGPAQTVRAYVNLGRWIVDCPVCNSGLQLPRGEYDSSWTGPPGGGPRIEVKPHWVLTDPTDGCLVCRIPLEIVWPDETDLIDAALSVRPHLRNRNWYSHETIQDLLDENERNL